MTEKKLIMIIIMVKNQRFCTWEKHINAQSFTTDAEWGGC